MTKTITKNRHGDMVNALMCCEGKEPLTPAIARKVARRQRRNKGSKSQAYKCPFCPHWHVGRAQKGGWRG